MSDHIPVEAFLAAYPEPIAELGEQLCSVVLGVVPDAVERVRPGGRLIGYDAPGARRKRYFCYIALETKHIHLGFEHGATMRDPHQRLLGAGARSRGTAHRAAAACGQALGDARADGLTGNLLVT